MIKTIAFETNKGAQNMQTDSELLDWAIENNTQKPIFRIYGWSPACVSLGRNQNDDFLDKTYLKSQNIDVVRRLTGGRALLHDKELTYLYIVPSSALEKGQSVVESYKEISQILINSFAELGINLEFGEKKQKHSEKTAKKSPDYCMSISTGADLCYQGKKLIGSAQLRKQGYILQHGSILFDYDKKLTEKIFGEKPSENFITCLSQINPDLTYDDVKESLLTNFHAKK